MQVPNFFTAVVALAVCSHALIVPPLPSWRKRMMRMKAATMTGSTSSWTPLLPSVAPWCKGRVVKTRAVEWCSGGSGDDGCGIFPLQHYHQSTPLNRELFSERRQQAEEVGAEALRMAEETVGDSTADGDEQSTDGPPHVSKQCIAAALPLSRSSQTMLIEQMADSCSSPDTKEELRRRLMQKIQAEARASLPLDASRHLHILYRDDDMIVVHKPSGILCVPGHRRNPSLASLVHDTLRLQDEYDIDKMVVHRLDMDTSGIVVFALNQSTLQQLHHDFRERDRGRGVKKQYQALVCGHVMGHDIFCNEGEIDLPIERDPCHPPFMRIATLNENLVDGKDEERQLQQINDESSMFLHEGFRKEIEKAPKPSLTSFRILSREYLLDSSGKRRLPVTRLDLTPYTGRTHQLRVHCAAIGHPIVGDDIYGHGGEGDMFVGFKEASQRNQFPSMPSMELQREIQALGLPLCLHAYQLCLYHPSTGAPMVFSAEPNF